MRLKLRRRFALSRTARAMWWAALGLAVVVVLAGCSGGDEVPAATSTSGAASAPSTADGTPARTAEQLGAHLNDLAEAVARTPVSVTTELGAATFTAGALGIELDAEATMEAVRAERSGGDGETWQPEPTDPTAAHLRFAIDRDLARSTVDDATELGQPPTPPDVFEQNGTLAVHLGEQGSRVNVDDLVASTTAALSASITQAAAAASAPDALEPIAVTATLEEVVPVSDSPELREALEAANEQFGYPPTLRFVDDIEQLPLATVSSWLRLTEADDTPHIEVDIEAVDASLAEMFADANAPEGPAGFSVDYSADAAGVPSIVNTEGGVRCCTAESTSAVIDALARDGATQVTLRARPAISADDHERLASLGIVERVATFTTPHNAAPYPSRVTNIQRMADLVRGAVIEPGGSFSLNDHVGRRTRDKGFVEGGALALGVLVKEVGGGVSQFATTAFNAAFFAGLDIDAYQMHSLYFPRYPFGREATVSYPAPDLRFTNNTDYGVLLWTRYTPTSISVDVYSTKNVWVEPEPASFVWKTWQCSGGAYSANCRAAVASPYSITQRQLCLRVVTTRNRRYADGSTQSDTFANTYQPKEGYGCDGRPRDPAAKICPEPEPEVPPVDDTAGGETTTTAAPAEPEPAEQPADETPAEQTPTTTTVPSEQAGEQAGDEEGPAEQPSEQAPEEQSPAEQASEEPAPTTTTAAPDEPAPTTTTAPSEPAEDEEPCWPLLPLPGEEASG